MMVMLLARTIVHLQSSADITAYPALYEFVQQHCPSTASNGARDMEAWLKEPLSWPKSAERASLSHPTSLPSPQLTRAHSYILSALHTP